MNSFIRWIGTLPLAIIVVNPLWVSGQTSLPHATDLPGIVTAKPVLSQCAGADENYSGMEPVQVVRLSSNVNSVGSELAPFRYADKIYYSSDKRDAPGQSLQRQIYTAVGSNPSFLFEGNPKSQKASAMDAMLTPDARLIYYSVCSQSEANRCEIWCREKDYNGKWGPVKRLPTQINLPGYTARQPGIGYISSMKKEVLFFSSNRPGGKGGYDIWCSTIEPDGSFSEPFNLLVNTEADEVTPFFYNNDQVLFFSSNRDGDNLGGFDIFNSRIIKNNTWGKAESLGELFNSSADDIYFTYHGNSRTGYFASNRGAGPGNTRSFEESDFDIYMANPLIHVAISLYDQGVQVGVDRTMAELTDITMGMPVLVSMATLSPAARFNLNQGLYVLEIRKPGYEPVSKLIDTREWSGAQVREIEFFLTRQADLGRE